ncbi:MATE family efflux transporter [Pseudomonas sichuanensis]|uniref:MATE family efflux transporter n=1 Tax=Pseudomonas TaxID=286 RepID=UPI0036E7E8F8
MVSSFLFLSFVGHALPNSQGHASFAWAFVSLATVTGIGFFSTLMIDVAASRNHNVESLRILLQSGLRLALGLGSLIVLAIYIYLHVMADSSEELNQPDGKILFLFSLSLPAIYLQIVIFNYLNALEQPKYEFMFVWCFNIALLTAASAYTVGAFDITIEQFVTAFSLLRWAFIVVTLLLLRKNFAPSENKSIARIPGSKDYCLFIYRGVPLAICFGGESFLYFAFSLIAKAQGDTSLAAYQATIHFLSLIYMISIGIGNATAISLAPAAITGEMNVVKRRLFEGLALGGLLLAPCLLICLYFSSSVANLYSADLATASLISDHLRLAAPFLVFEFIYIVARMVLRSLGDFWIPTLMTILCMNGLGLSVVAGLFWIYAPDTQFIFWSLTISTLVLMTLLTWRLALHLLVDQPMQLLPGRAKRP